MAVCSTTDSLNIISFNCEGLNRTKDYINEFLTNNKSDIVGLQETWTIDQNLYQLGNIHPCYLFSGKSGVDSSSDILVGRPKGGVAILYKKSIAKYVKCIDIASNRACGIIIQTEPNYNVAIICTYMPCDSYSNTHVSDIFVETLDAIEHAINENTCDAYILCGDFNTSFHRDNAQTRFLSDFI